MDRVYKLPIMTPKVIYKRFVTSIIQSDGESLKGQAFSMQLQLSIHNSI